MAHHSNVIPVPDELGEDFQILHWSDPDADPPHSRALCGKPRDRALKPGAEGEFCVVCADLHQAKEVARGR